MGDYFMRRRDFLAAAPAGALLLADGRESPYTICLSDDASPSERRGARELQWHVEQMCGAKLKIAAESERPAGPLILVGQSRVLDRLGIPIAFENLGSEGFVLKTSGPHVVIAGGRKRGTMYGVSEFLEKLGCRWYAPDCTHVPKRAKLQVPALDQVQKPSFEYREILVKEATNKDWAARNRTNGHFSELDESTGGKFIIEPFVHSFYAIIPPATYASAHPEYFALVNGERRFERAQLCLSNPEVLRIAIETVFRWIREHPEAAVYSVSPNDADAPCECPSCRRVEQEEGAHSGLLLRFVNAIADEVARKHPDKLVETLAYRYSEPAPKKIRPRPNVRVRLALSGVCEAHPFGQCRPNDHPVGLLKAWSRVTDQIYVWHYMTNFHQTLEPHPNLDELSANIGYYRRHGVTGLFLQGPYSKGGGGELAELRNYLCAKLLWNPEADAQAIIREFTGAYYGPAAQAMRQYIDRAHHEVRLPPRGRGQSLYMYAGPDFAPDFLPRAHKLFEEMESVTKRPEATTFARRVKKAKLAIESVELFKAKRFVLEGDKFGPADLRDFWARYDRFIQAARSFGMTEIYENVPFEAMDREYRRYVKSYPTAVVENSWLRVTAVPGFYGRIVSLIDKRSGQNILRMPEPDDRLNSTEVLGGLVLLAHPDFYSRTHYESEWTVESNDGVRELILRGVCSNGLALQRTLRLSPQAPVVETVTIVRNQGKTPLPVTLQSRAEINPGDRENPRIDFAFPSRGGAAVRKRILPQVAANYGDEFYRDGERPAGEWSLINPPGNFTLTNLFADDQVERCRFWWRGRRRNTIALSVWSPRRTLAPGETLTFRTDYAALQPTATGGRRLS